MCVSDDFQVWIQFVYVFGCFDVGFWVIGGDDEEFGFFYLGCVKDFWVYWVVVEDWDCVEGMGQFDGFY